MSYHRIQPFNRDKKLRAYIIGVALGDGNLSNPNRRAIRLRVTCDRKYPLLITHIQSRLALLLPKNRIGIVNHKNYVDISAYSNHWKTLLWKCGDGPKDKQNVSVPQWVRENKTYAKEALRGLLQTDGSIYQDRNYPMVNFVNTASALRNDVFTMIQSLGYRPNMQRLKQKNGKIKHTIRVSKNVKEFIQEIDLWKK
ncbi:MAG: LAGLIDADG family homing endonuclease [Patescibacteria group bacterium]